MRIRIQNDKVYVEERSVYEQRWEVTREGELYDELKESLELILEKSFVFSDKKARKKRIEELKRELERLENLDD